MTRTVVVTGANRGLGLALARSFRMSGWDVIGTARDSDRAKALAETGAEVVPLDQSNSASVAGLAKALSGRAVDLLVNNAGVYSEAGEYDPDHGMVGELDATELGRVLAINTVGPVLVTQALLPNLEAGRERKIVAITSRMGSIATMSGGALPYRTSKAALNAAFKVMSIDLGRQGFTVVVMCPGWVRTDMGGPSATLPADRAAAILTQRFEGLSRSDNGRFLTVDGSESPW